MRDHLRDKTPLEKALYALLFAAIVGAGVVIAVAQPEDPYASQPQHTNRAAVERPPAPRPQSTRAAEPATPGLPATGEADSSDVEAPTSDGARPCSELGIPTSPPEPVTCRSRTAILTIADEADPVLLGSTHVRLLRARLGGSALFVRLRVRNETEAEQGVAAGGQEIYVNVAGVRIDPRPVPDVRVPPQTGETVDIVFNIPAKQRAAISAAGDRVEVGVTPWTDGDPGDRVVGVIRARVPGAD